jgi:hypothetical protein
MAKDKSTLTETKTDAQAFAEAIKSVESGLQSVKEASKDVKEEFQPLVSLQVQLNKLVDEEVKQRKGVENSFKRGLGLGLDEARIREANELLAQAILAEDEDAAEKAEEKIKALQKQGKLNEEAYGAIKDFFPGIFSGLKMVQNAQRIWNQITKKHPILFIASALIAIVTTMIMIVKRVNAMKEQFGLAGTEAAKVAGQLTLINIKMRFFGISAEQVASSMEALSNTFGEVSPAMVRFAGDMALVARNAGITSEEAASMVSLFQATHGASKEVALEMIKSTRAMAELTGLSPGIIMKEMAENADLFASHLGQSEQNLMAAVAQAKKLGMEFGQLTEFGDGLLDITERINKEQMLSAMLGKQVNLQKAAMLQAQGDEVGFMQELSNQLQGVGELTAQQRRLFSSELGIATADVMKLAGLQSGMAQRGAQIPGQNPYEQARFKQGEKMLKAINNPQYAS